MFFFPFADDNPHTGTPFVTWGLMALCVLTFLWQKTLDPQSAQVAILAYGVIPADLFGTADLNPIIQPLPAWMTIFTSMFLHGGWAHLGGNMLFLWIYGDNVEASLGRLRFLLLYFISGLAAALAQSLLAPTSTIPMVGASGAIAGVLGAYLILHPFSNIKVFAWIIFYVTVINVPAWIVLGFWFVGQVMSQASTVGGGAGVAFMAHIAGFVAGIALVFKLRRPGVPLFQRSRSRAFAARTRSIRRRRGGSVPRSGGRGPWD